MFFYFWQPSFEHYIFLEGFTGQVIQSDLFIPELPGDNHENKKADKPGIFRQETLGGKKTSRLA